MSGEHERRPGAARTQAVVLQRRTRQRLCVRWAALLSLCSLGSALAQEGGPGTEETEQAIRHICTSNYGWRWQARQDLKAGRIHSRQFARYLESRLGPRGFRGDSPIADQADLAGWDRQAGDDWVQTARICMYVLRLRPTEDARGILRSYVESEVIPDGARTEAILTLAKLPGTTDDYRKYVDSESDLLRAAAVTALAQVQDAEQTRNLLARMRASLEARVNAQNMEYPHTWNALANVQSMLDGGPGPQDAEHTEEAIRRICSSDSSWQNAARQALEAGRVTSGQIARYLQSRLGPRGFRGASPIVDLAVWAGWDRHGGDDWVLTARICMYVLRLSPTEDARGVLRRYVESADLRDEVRAEAILTLAKLPGTSDYRSYVDSENDRLRAAAVSALAQVEDAEETRKRLVEMRALIWHDGRYPHTCNALSHVKYMLDHVERLAGKSTEERLRIIVAGPLYELPPPPMDAYISEDPASQFFWRELKAISKAHPAMTVKMIRSRQLERPRSKALLEQMLRDLGLGPKGDMPAEEPEGQRGADREGRAGRQ